MASSTITVELDDRIIERIDQNADRRGLSIHEVIRECLGDMFSSPISIPPNNSFSFPMPVHSAGGFQGDFGNIMKGLANLLSAQGMAKCKNCTQSLSSGDIISGECGKCGTPL